MMKKPSDPLPPPEIGGGDSDPNAIYQAVGRALSAWEDVENQVADIFSLLTAQTVGPESLPASRAYGSIAAFRGRSEMVTAAAEAFFLERPDTGLKAEIKALLRKCDEHSVRRNEIAHGVVQVINGRSGDREIDEAAQDDTCYLVPPRYNSRKARLIPTNTQIQVRKGDNKKAAVIAQVRDLIRRGMGTYKYNSIQVEHYATAFVNLAMAANATVARLQGAVERARPV